MPAKLRPAGITLCLASLVWLGIPGAASASTTSTATASTATVSTATLSTATLSTAAARATALPGQGHSGTSTVGLSGWQVQSSAAATSWTTGTGAIEAGNQISEPGFDSSGWLTVRPDSAGAVGTEVEALLQHGICPDDSSLQPVNQSPDSHASVFYSDNLQNCFGAPMTNPAADTNPLFDMPWWFRTDFHASPRSGRDEKLVLNGVMGQADVWVNGTEIATQATVEGDYTSYTFDVSNLLRPGTNTLALELYPNNPSTMFTLDDVDWNQIPPDNNTGIQFPVQLHVSDALGISNTYVTQQDTADLSSAALTVHADVTNSTPLPQAGTVAATISPPGHGAPITVSRQVSLGPSQSETVTFSPAAYGQLTISHPQVWWPYQMGGQPLYRLNAAVFSQGRLSDAAAGQDFGIRTVDTYLTKPSTLLPEGARVFEVNGVPFDFRAGGWSENIFLHYSASDLANQITLMKSMGIDGIRTEGKEMPQDFYNQMDRAGILIDAGYQCCDKWAPSSSGRSVTSQDYHVMYDSALTIGQQLRDHPSVLNFSWSDNNPIAEQEVVSDAGFSQAGFQDPIISSAEYNPAAIYGASGEKEGPYDWVPPNYWYDTTHSSNNALDEDSTLTNVGGAWGFDSEQSAGDTVPTMDSINRFMSPADQAALWQQPDAHQFHTNYESTDGTHSGYDFGTLDNLDTAIAGRYGQWHSLAQYVQEAQVQNYEDTRAQFEAFIDHWNSANPSTGTDYWQLNKGWPTLLWDLYNSDYDQAGSYFGAKKANEDLHVLYAYDTGKVTIDNLTGVSQPGLTVQSTVYSVSGSVLDSQTTASPVTLAPQQVRNGILSPKVPAVTAPPTPASTYFVELILRQHGTVVDRNVYWLSTQQDVIDWDTGNPNDTTEGSPQADNGAPLSQYADMTALQKLPSESVQVSADTVRQRGPNGDDLTTNVTITNPSSNKSVAFFLRADVRRGTATGAAESGDNEVLPITWTDNDITLWPGQSETLTASYRSADLRGASPVVSVYGWNVPQAVFAAPQGAAAAAAVHAASTAARVEYFGNADGQALVRGTARPGVGSQPGTAPVNQSHPRSGPAWTINSVANSPDTTPSTSFTQGDNADTYTLTVRNSGTTATDGKTPVTVTDILDPNLSYTSISGTGWSCDDSNNPTLVCTETSGPGNAPAVLEPGQSYPPITVTVQVPLGTGYGNQDSNDGLHVTNALSVAGGSPATRQVSLAIPTPIAGVPQLTADNAVDGAFRQGDAGDRYEITVINSGGAATSGSSSDPITATVTAPAGETIQALYGSGWTCSLAATTTPQAEPADTCTRTDVLAGENAEEPPITAVVSVAASAPASATESVSVSGGGSQGGPATVTAATTIEQAADLNAASTHSGAFSQGGTGSYTLSVSNVDGPNASSTGGPTYGLVSVADTLPWGLTATAMSGSGWTCDVSAVTCYRSDTLAAGGSYPPVTLAVNVAQNAPASVTNSVTVAGGGMTTGPDSSTSAGGQTGTDATTVTQTGPAGTPPTPPAAPSLTVTSTHSGGFAQGDAGDAYRLRVSNGAAAGPASGLVTVTDAVPAGLTPVEMYGRGWTCSLAPAISVVTSTGRHGSVPNTYAPQPTCFRFGTLAAGRSYPPVTLRVAVANNTQPSVTNQVTVSGGGSTPASDSDVTGVGQLPELAVSSYDSGGGVPYGPFLRGGAERHDTYDITVANDGYAPTTGAVTFTADLPAGVQPLAMSGAGWSCALATATCTTNGGVSLAAGQQELLTLTVGVSQDAPPDLQTYLQASGGGEVPAAGLDENNDYSVVTGGSFVDPTYVTGR
jgi:exo-1,4-beta-D-glucosaminidase